MKTGFGSPRGGGGGRLRPNSPCPGPSCRVDLAQTLPPGFDGERFRGSWNLGNLTGEATQLSSDVMSKSLEAESKGEG